MSMVYDDKYFNFKIFNLGPTIYIAVLMVYSCHSTSTRVQQLLIRSLLVGLDVVDKPICGGVVSCGWSGSPQLWLNYLGQLLAQFNPATIIIIINFYCGTYSKTTLMT